MTADREFLFNYRFAEADWGIAIHASSPEEAKQKIKSVAFARYEGEVAARIHVPGRLRRLMRWIAGDQP